ncbi:hypothetical protein ACIA5D_36500 [Actinoplanes sp. NPDC051513]|uniref:hypothetical protein n=1 Tax=Actinoplanes sp. NPDC051513 TaxID=3363908 RepID=UPI0037ACE818
MTTVLYRRFDGGERLLYIGISDWLYDRAVMHGAKSLWTEFAATGTNTWYPSRAEAKQAEEAAIREERPLFNRYHSALGAKERLVDYLTALGRADLLEAISSWKWSYSETGRCRSASIEAPR